MGMKFLIMCLYDIFFVESVVFVDICIGLFYLKLDDCGGGLVMIGIVIFIVVFILFFDLYDDLNLLVLLNFVIFVKYNKFCCEYF